MPSSLILSNCRIYTGDEVLTNRFIRIENDRIAEIGEESHLSESAGRVDLQGWNVAPGFIDLQLNGGGGHFFTQTPTTESLEAMHQANLRHGTTHFLPTLVSSPAEKIQEAIRCVKGALQNRQPGVLGLHVEGPFFHPERMGAHKKEYVRPPSSQELQEIIQAGKDVVRILTLAPELCSDEQLQLLVKAGFVVSAGHSNATYDQALHFFGQGVGKVTHLYNAMSGFGHREPGLVGATFDQPRWTSIIVDGFHCHYATVRVAKQLLKEKLFLITDAVDSVEDLPTLPERSERYGDFVTRYRYEGGRFITDDGRLAGSCITMIDAIRNCVQHAGIPLEEALRMASTYPAAAIGLDQELGRIKSGYRAALAVFDDALAVKGTVVGQEVSLKMASHA